MIQATLRMDFAPQKMDEALKILRSIIERIRAETAGIGAGLLGPRGGARGQQLDRGHRLTDVRVGDAMRSLHRLHEA